VVGASPWAKAAPKSAEMARALTFILAKKKEKGSVLFLLERRMISVDLRDNVNESFQQAE
jgi:hypothetical protein